MPVFGDLGCMPLTDLLQWLAGSAKTGTLEIERNKSRKIILFRKGRIVACGSDEPADLLGHWLVSRGKISEETLRRALARQGLEPRHLGSILVELGAISREELDRDLTTKAEETIYGLFEWPDGTFRFRDGGSDAPNNYPVNLRVDDVLLRGAQRFDEVQRIRAVFNDSGMVLRKTSRTPPPEVLRNRMAKAIYDLADGHRTVAEILLHAHASEFAVTKFLFELNRIGLVEIVHVRPAVPDPVPAAPPPLPADRDATGPSVLRPGGPAVEPSPAPVTFAPPATVSSPAVAPVARPADPTTSAPAASPGPIPAATAAAIDLEVARKLLNRGEFEAALDILDAAYKAQPGDEALRRLVAEAEAAFAEKAYRHYLPASKVLALTRPVEELGGEPLSPAEFFLISRIDGSWDVRSIIQIAPLREVDALRTLKRLRERGLIEVRDPS